MIAITPEQARRWLGWIIQSRLADQAEESLVRQGRGESFQMSCGGHEAIAVFAQSLRPSDWIYPHYRDRALLIARGVSQEELFATFFATAASSSGGRQMTAHFSARAQNIVSLSSPVGSSALHAVGTAQTLKARQTSDVVLCLLGDATTQEGEVYEAIAQAASEPVGVVFCIEDNGYGISTATRGKTFWSLGGESSEFLGIPITRVAGWQADAVHAAATTCINQARLGQPQILVLQIERLVSHSSSDAQQVYRSAEELAQIKDRDPLIYWQNFCLAQGWVTLEQIEQLQAEAQHEIDQAIVRVEPSLHPQITADLGLFPAEMPIPELLLTELAAVLAKTNGDITLRQVLGDTLSFLLSHDAGTVLHGQDIADPKGDVFGVTRGLSTRFGANRVRNSPLAEATILGTSVGRAIAGERPIAFLQFIDFVGPGLNQLFNEVATLYWRSKGEWSCPMVIMAPCGAYRAGLGPWHSQTNEGLFAHIPGLDIVMPSNAWEAGFLLLKAFISQRPTLYLYPKALLNQRVSAVQLQPAHPWLAVAHLKRLGKDVTLVGWGNTVSLCQEAANHLASEHIHAEVISLPVLSPLDTSLIETSVLKTRRLVVVHEDNQTCGLGAEILARVQENLPTSFRAKRVVRPDVQVPFNFANQLRLLPSVETIITAVHSLQTTYAEPVVTAVPAVTPAPSPQELLPVSRADDAIAIPVPRVAPSDEAAILIGWQVAVGDRVTAGQVLADLEGDKAIFELESPQAGLVQALLHEAGAQIAVGEPLLYLIPDVVAVVPIEVTRPVVTAALAANSPMPNVHASMLTTPRLVGMASYVPTTVITNEDLVQRLPDKITDVQWIVQRTGIHQRPIAPEGMTVVDMGVAAAQKALERSGLQATDLHWLIVATTTPMQVIPSTACQIQARIGAGNCAAFDISATCSGFLYALAVARGAVAAQPDINVMVVTAEKMRSVVDPNDLGTAILFGDAATACILTRHSDLPGFLLQETIIHAEHDHEKSIVLTRDPGYLEMDGTSIFRTAVLKMSQMCEQMRTNHQLAWSDVAWVIPHQANLRILQALAKRLKIPEKRIFSNIATLGNTSSSSIPLCLEQLQQQKLVRNGNHLLACAVGGGVTYGGAYLQYVE